MQAVPLVPQSLLRVQGEPGVPVVVVPPRQVPAVQVCPVAQRLPQKPQLATSAVTSVQAVPHICRGVAQVEVPPQRPLTQA